MDDKEQPQEVLTEEQKLRMQARALGLKPENNAAEAGAAGVAIVIPWAWNFYVADEEAPKEGYGPPMDLAVAVALLIVGRRLLDRFFPSS